MVYIGVRDREAVWWGGGAWKFGQMVGKMKKIRADVPEKMLCSGYFIRIEHTNLSNCKLSTAHPQKASAPYSYDGTPF